MSHNITLNTPERMAAQFDATIDAAIALITNVDAIVATGATATTGTAVGTVVATNLAALKAAINLAVDGSVY